MREYSIYEAKARFSEVIRQVREGRSIRVSYRGKPVAEIRPIEKETGLEKRIDRLRERGALVVPDEPTEIDLRPVDRRPGALERFLGERNA
jgi:prevent-host-death family protein